MNALICTMVMRGVSASTKTPIVMSTTMVQMIGCGMGRPHTIGASTSTQKMNALRNTSLPQVGLRLVAVVLETYCSLL